MKHHGYGSLSKLVFEPIGRLGIISAVIEIEM